MAVYGKVFGSTAIVAAPAIYGLVFGLTATITAADPNADLRRRTELCFQRELQTLLEWEVFVSRGPDVNQAALVSPRMEPPFILLEAEEGEELIAGRLWSIPLLVGFVTALTDTQPSEHSKKVDQLYAALRSIPAPAADPDLNFRLDGFDVQRADSFTDESRQARADYYRLAVGCGSIT